MSVSDETLHTAMMNKWLDTEMEKAAMDQSKSTNWLLGETGSLTGTLTAGPGISPKDSDPIFSREGRLAMLQSRLRTKCVIDMGFDHLDTAYAGDKIFVWLIVKGEPVTLTDEADMFPSDTLITQMRLLK